MKHPCIEALVGASVVATLMGPAGDAAAAHPRPGRTERVSVALDGTEADRFAGIASSSIGANGRWVAFESTATNLVPLDANLSSDVFVHDRRTQTTEMVSISSLGIQGTGSSSDPYISANGRYVAFHSDAANLVVGDTNLATDVFVHDRRTGRTDRVSVTSHGNQAMAPALNHPSRFPSISGNGRYVAFESHASDLVADDTNDVRDVFVHDRREGTTRRASLTASGDQSEGGGLAGNLSADGRYLVYTSPGSDKVPGDTNLIPDVFVRNLRTGKLERVSVAADGMEAARSPAGFFGSETQNATASLISSGGRYIAFYSWAGNLVPNDADSGAGFGDVDVFVHDRVKGRTERVSVSSQGTEAVGSSWVVDGISRDGRHVVFSSTADNLYPRDPGSTTPLDGLLGGDWHFFVHDRSTGATELVSRTRDGQEGTGCPQGAPEPTARFGSVSGNGRFLSFNSCADNLVRDDTNETYDVFVLDRGLPLSVGDLLASGQALSLSLDGAPRFARTGTAWIEDAASDAISTKLGAGGEFLGARITYRPALDDIFVALELESMPRTPELAAVTTGSVYGMSFSLDGRPYEIRAASTGLGPSGETTADFGLFSCAGGEPLCTKVAELQGGFGTTGERITFSIPLDDLDIEDGSVISDVRSFTALGSISRPTAGN